MLLNWQKRFYSIEEESHDFFLKKVIYQALCSVLKSQMGKFEVCFHQVHTSTSHAILASSRLIFPKPAVSGSVGILFPKKFFCWIGGWRWELCFQPCYLVCHSHVVNKDDWWPWHVSCLAVGSNIGTAKEGLCSIIQFQRQAVLLWTPDNLPSTSQWIVNNETDVCTSWPHRTQRQ